MIHLHRFSLLFLFIFCFLTVSAQGLKLNDSGFFESRSSDLRVYDNPGSLRLSHNNLPLILSGGVYADGMLMSAESRNQNIAGDRLEVKLVSKDYSCFLKIAPKGLGFTVGVFLAEALPSGTDGHLNLGIDIPSSLYFGKTRIVDGRPDMISDETVHGNSFILAPEDDAVRLSVRSENDIVMKCEEEVMRVFSSIPAGKVGEVIQWYVEPSFTPGSKRETYIRNSRVGYVSGQKKTAVIFVEGSYSPETVPTVCQINENGYRQDVLQSAAERWGEEDGPAIVLTSDISGLKESGVYCIQYGDVESDAFVVSDDVFDRQWVGALKRLPALLADGHYDPDILLSRLTDLWERFRPDLDCNGNGVPEVIDMVGCCARRLLETDAIPDEMTVDAKYIRIASLIAAGRVLRGFDDDLSAKAGSCAAALWNTVSKLKSENRMNALIQLWYATSDDLYKKELFSAINKSLKDTDGFASALPLYELFDSRLTRKMNGLKPAYSSELESRASATPYGIPNLDGDALMAWALDYYLMWKTFPDSADPSVVLNCLSSVYGSHTYADDYLLESMTPESLPNFIALSMAAEKIASVMSR